MNQVARAYLELTKPGITLFIGVTAGAGFVTALGGWAMPGRLAVTLLATMLMSGGAATLNQVAEEKWDALMRRTASRPLPAGNLSSRSARLFGWSLSVSGLVLALAMLPGATAVVLVLCHVSYVNVYTPLKRRTPLCTLAGAIPGALPVLAGWVATGQPIGLTAVALTGVLFMWQIPHFLAIGWMAREDYGAAGCPMLSVVDPSGRSSARVALVYAAGMLLFSIVVGATAGTGPFFMAIALLTGTAYLGFAWGLVRELDRVPARRLFFSSIIVLPLLLTALVVDLVMG